MSITVKELEEYFELPDGILHKEISEEHIVKISTFLAAWKLVAPHLDLEKQEIESIDNDAKTEEEKRLLMLQRWKQAFIFKATYKRLLEALLSIKRADQARKVCQVIVNSEDTHANIQEIRTTKPSSLSVTDELIGSLSHINRWKDTQVIEEAQKQAISHFISQCVRSGHSLESIQEQLLKLHSEELLISKEMLTAACQMAANECKINNPTPEPMPNVTPGPNAKLTDKEVRPLFCKDTIYHASLCSSAVSVNDAGDYQNFFKKVRDYQTFFKEGVPGHSFKAVSFSRSKDNSFLIAQNGESTFYFAFKGKLSLSDWAKDFKSFNEGIRDQCNIFPIRYIVELLNKQFCIVLTGFSFGGLLASAIAACVWDTPYISSDLLKRNMTCITFGQPCVEVEIIRSVARRRPEMVTTVHAIFIEEDHIPNLMSLLDECWSAKIQQMQTESALRAQNPPVLKSMPFEDETTHLLLQIFSKLQTTQQDSSELIINLKDKLEEVLRNIKTHKLLKPSYTVHTISSSDGGLILRSDIKESPNYSVFTADQIQCLTNKIFNKHFMSEFSNDIFVGYLDKAPRYSFPKRIEGALGDIKEVTPEIHEVHIHHHSNQSAIVIEGRNLWFCYQVSFRGQKVSIPASDISGSSIRFNVTSLKASNQGQTDENVTLGNYFKSRPIRQAVEVHEKEFMTTIRQDQLARLTPSQVIELAYLSALLEQHCDNVQSARFSHKFEVVQTFLKDVVKVVPFESIVYAIANGSQQTEMKCAKVLKAHETSVPTTTLMTHGLLNAAYHLMFGVSMPVIHSMRQEALEKFDQIPKGTFYPGIPNEIMYLDMDSKRLIFSIILPPEAAVIGEDIKIVESKPIEVHIDAKDLKLAGMGRQEIAKYLIELQYAIIPRNIHPKEFDHEIELVGTASIEDLYPVQVESDKSSFLKSPLDILVTGRKRLAELSRIAKSSPESHSNQQMLDIVNSIRNDELDTCTALLGGFMHQNEVNIILCSSNKSSSDEVRLNAPASVGIWALFSLDYSHVQPVLAKCQGEQLLLKLLDYVKGISAFQQEPENTCYAAKLQFLVQGMIKTVTCNTQHVSYSLERQLVEVCEARKINAEMGLSKLIGKWPDLFKENTLSLVQRKCRPLIARWLKWALMIHNLREELAKYTVVGVVGLVNSGKSKLVNSLFGIEIPTGTTESKRTTIPFLYNFDGKMEGLNVVDFPGMDDEDNTIGELADLLLTIAQIIIFVVDYRKIHTQSAKKWLERLNKEKVPSLICLSFGDILYAEHMTESGDHPSVTAMSDVVKSYIRNSRDKLRSIGPGLHQIKFFSFCQGRDSVLNSDSGRQKLRDVGIGTPLQVGEWLVKVFNEDFRQNDLASQLEVFIGENVRNASTKEL